MHHSIRFVLAFAIAGVLAACSDTSAPATSAFVSMKDECDPATFNAALGAGTCTRQGNTTFAQFNAELTASHRVAAWQFVPTELSVLVGQSVQAKNDGGEMHTFTEVETFGGGIIPELNEASGNPTVAPECAALANADLVLPGRTFTTDVATEAGTEHYQCCIHPWMRAEVTVSGS
jgi:plastocyanin